MNQDKCNHLLLWFAYILSFVNKQLTSLLFLLLMPLDCLCHPNLDPFFFFKLSSLNSSTHPPFPKYQSSQHGFRLDVCLFEFINATKSLKCTLLTSFQHFWTTKAHFCTIFAQFQLAKC